MKLIIKILFLSLISISYSCSQRPAVPGKRIPVSHGRQIPVPTSSKPSQSNSNNSTYSPENTTLESSSSNAQVEINIIEDKKMTPQEIFAQSSSAVFMIYTSNENDSFQGSGFFVSSAGLAVSNYHVFEGTNKGAEVIKLQDGRQYKLKDVILKDKENDIMIFTIDAGSASFKYLELSKRQPRVGDRVYAIGSPRGLENTFSSGEISQLRHNKIIQISAPIDHGSSGGALINEYGEVIGITSAGLDDSGANLNFAISIEQVRMYVE